MFYRASLGTSGSIGNVFLLIDTSSIHERIVVRSAAVTDAQKGACAVDDLQIDTLYDK